MAGIITTHGLYNNTEFGSILPHEHIIVDLRTWDTPAYAQAEVEEVIQLMIQEIKKTKKVGVTAKEKSTTTCLFLKGEQ